MTLPKGILLCLAATILCIAGCHIKNPLYTDSCTLNNSKYLGRWKILSEDYKEDSPEQDDVVYSLTAINSRDIWITKIKGEDEPYSFYLGRVIKLNSDLFLDVQPVDSGDYQKEVNLLGSHIIIKLDKEKDKYYLSFLNSEALIEKSLRDKQDIKLDTTGEFLIINETESAQKLISHYAQDSVIFKNEKRVYAKKIK